MRTASTRYADKRPFAVLRRTGMRWYVQYHPRGLSCFSVMGDGQLRPTFGALSSTVTGRCGSNIVLAAILYRWKCGTDQADQHDETFLVTQGTLRFHALNGQTIDAKTGDYVTVPTRSPHTFSNPYDEEAKFFNTYTPAFYINYFKLLATLGAAGKPMNPEANRKAMAVSLLLKNR